VRGAYAERNGRWLLEWHATGRVTNTWDIHSASNILYL
jgi:hypothetical protein